MKAVNPFTFCNYCGAELVINFYDHLFENQVVTYLVCPNREDIMKPSPHWKEFLSVAPLHNNYDPYTGEKVMQ